MVARGRVNEEQFERDRSRALALISVSRETLPRLDAFAALLRRWQGIKNLVGPSELTQIWTRHIADSAQLVHFASDAQTWVDIGSGAGFPGLVVACCRADDSAFHMTLVESNGRKAAFLREAARVLGLNVSVVNERIEAAGPHLPRQIDCISARALAPLPLLLDLAVPLMRNPCKALFLKGQDIDVELTEASKYWNIYHRVEPSVTNPSGRILIIDQCSLRG